MKKRIIKLWNNNNFTQNSQNTQNNLYNYILDVVKIDVMRRICRRLRHDGWRDGNGEMRKEKGERRKEKGEKINGERGTDERLAEHPARQAQWNECHSADSSESVYKRPDEMKFCVFLRILREAKNDNEDEDEDEYTKL